eukprot:gene14028-19966_t
MSDGDGAGQQNLPGTKPDRMPSISLYKAHSVVEEFYQQFQTHGVGCKDAQHMSVSDACRESLESNHQHSIRANPKGGVAADSVEAAINSDVPNHNDDVLRCDGGAQDWLVKGKAAQRLLHQQQGLPNDPTPENFAAALQREGGLTPTTAVTLPPWCATCGLPSCSCCLTDVPAELVTLIYDYLVKAGDAESGVAGYQPPHTSRSALTTAAAVERQSIGNHNESHTMAEALATSRVRRRGNSMLGGDGLQDAVRLSIACKQLRSSFINMLKFRPDLEFQVLSNIRTDREKRRIMRRLTLSQHNMFMKREVTFEVASCSLLAAAMGAVCLLLSVYPWLDL